MMRPPERSDGEAGAGTAGETVRPPR